MVALVGHGSTYACSATYDVRYVISMGGGGGASEFVTQNRIHVCIYKANRNASVEALEADYKEPSTRKKRLISDVCFGGALTEQQNTWLCRSDKGLGVGRNILVCKPKAQTNWMTNHSYLETNAHYTRTHNNPRYLVHIHLPCK